MGANLEPGGDDFRRREASGRFGSNGKKANQRKEEVMSVNKEILVGRLGADPELKCGASGAPMCRFSVATNETFKDKTGEPQKRTEWHSVACFGKLAEICGEYLTKSKLASLKGRSAAANGKTGRATNASRSISSLGRCRCCRQRRTGTVRKQRVSHQPKPTNQMSTIIRFVRIKLHRRTYRFSCLPQI
ncbi:MAG: single-stranded DNA-binding protein [Terriglobia bacterium]